MMTSKWWITGACAAAIGFGVWTGFDRPIAEAASSHFSSTVNVAVQLDGGEQSALRAFEGGGISAEIVSEKIGADKLIKKHLARPSYEPIKLTWTLGTSPSLERWVAEQLEGKAPRRSGVVSFADANFNIAEKLSFKDALISAVNFPSFDAADSKTPALLTLTLAPESTQRIPGGGEKLGPLGNATRPPLSANFRLELDGMDTTGVLKIEPFIVTQALGTTDLGATRDVQREPGALEIGNLVVHVSAQRAADFEAWHRSFVVDGKNSEADEKRGAIVLLAPDMKEVTRIRFDNIGIASLERSPVQANTERVSELVAELYVERVHFGNAPAARALTPKAVKVVR